MAASIFISHSTQDRKVAATLCAALESRGFQCWISSRDILPGENFQVAIVRAIRKVKIMLLVFTANSNTSEEMTKELALASQQKLMVVPLRIEDVAPSEAFSYEFATRQWVDFFADWELAMDQLSVRLANALGVEPSPPKLEPKAEPVAAEVKPPVAVLAAEAAEARLAESPVKLEPPPPPKVEPPPPAPVAKVEAPAAPPAKVEPAATDIWTVPPPAKPAEPVAKPPEVKPAEVKPPAAEVKPAAPAAKAPDVKPVDGKKPDATIVMSAAALAAAKAAPAKPAAPAKKSQTGLFVIIGVVILLVAGLGYLGMTMLGKTSAAKPGLVTKVTPKVTPPEAPPTVTLTNPTAPPTVDPNAPPAVDPNAPPTPPKPKRPPKAHHPKSDVPY